LILGLDRSQLIDEALQGQGVLLNGPYLPSSSAYRPALLASRSPDFEGAGTALADAGWIQSEETGIRSAGDVALRLRLVYSQDLEATAAAMRRQWERLGVGIDLQPVSAADLQQVLHDRAFDVAVLEVVPLGDPDLYDFWSQEAIVRGRNFGGWNSRRASEALETARQTWDNAERGSWYERFIILYDQALPALTLYQHVSTFALSPAVKELPGPDQPTIGRVDTLRERYDSFASWFLLYRDVLVDCPEQASRDDS
jgi:peptide/nickel transport system substrate-binding protein